MCSDIGGHYIPTNPPQWLTYWVVYAFLTVFESAVSAVYWFREFHCNIR